MREGEYQNHIIRRLKVKFPYCFILKNDSSYLQGVPDLLVLHGNKWAMLEVKISKHAKSQKNQHYYVSLLNNMSFAAFIYPENEEEVFDALQQAFSDHRSTRFPWG
jgi:hypothetical protein